MKEGDTLKDRVGQVWLESWGAGRETLHLVIGANPQLRLHRVLNLETGELVEVDAWILDHRNAHSPWRRREEQA